MTTIITFKNMIKKPSHPSEKDSRKLIIMKGVGGDLTAWKRYAWRLRYERKQVDPPTVRLYQGSGKQKQEVDFEKKGV